MITKKQLFICAALLAVGCYENGYASEMITIAGAIEQAKGLNLSQLQQNLIGKTFKYASGCVFGIPHKNTIRDVTSNTQNSLILRIYGNPRGKFYDTSEEVSLDKRGNNINNRFLPFSTRFHPTGQGYGVLAVTALTTITIVYCFRNKIKNTVQSWLKKPTAK